MLKKCGKKHTVKCIFRYFYNFVFHIVSREFIHSIYTMLGFFLIFVFFFSTNKTFQIIHIEFVFYIFVYMTCLANHYPSIHLFIYRLIRFVVFRIMIQLSMQFNEQTLQNYVFRIDNNEMPWPTSSSLPSLPRLKGHSSTINSSSCWIECLNTIRLNIFHRFSYCSAFYFSQC